MTDEAEERRLATWETCYKSFSCNTTINYQHIRNKAFEARLISRSPFIRRTYSYVRAEFITSTCTRFVSTRPPKIVDSADPGPLLTEVGSFTSDEERTSASNSTPSDKANSSIEVTYPEGGRDAWLVVLGACCGLMASLGIYNTAGVFEVVVSQTILPNEAPSKLGWIFSVYAFVVWICGVQIGPTFDAMGPRSLLVAGTVCTLTGILSLSICTGKISLKGLRSLSLKGIQSITRSSCHSHF
nr:riboflavin transporter mch5 [Quercus suber]